MLNVHGCANQHNANAHLPRRQVQAEDRITSNAATVRCSSWLGATWGHISNASSFQQRLEVSSDFMLQFLHGAKLARFQPRHAAF